MPSRVHGHYMCPVGYTCAHIAVSNGVCTILHDVVFEMNVLTLSLVDVNGIC